MVRQLVDRNGKLNEKVEDPAAGRRPAQSGAGARSTPSRKEFRLHAVARDDCHQLDKDFATLHPKQLRRVVLGPFIRPASPRTTPPCRRSSPRCASPKTPGC
jgi:hypothetical protein